MANITSSISIPTVRGVKIPESKATAPRIYAYFVPDRRSDFRSREFSSDEIVSSCNSFFYHFELNRHLVYQKIFYVLP